MTIWDPYIFVLSLSFVVSLTVFYKLNPADSWLRYFPPFLLMTLFIEFLGLWLNENRRDNVIVYNFFTTFEFCFYLWIISLMIKNKSMKQWIRIILIVYALAATTNIIFITPKHRFHTVTYALGCLVVVAICIYYFYELFRFPGSLRLASNPAFWICSGLLFFYCCGFPLFGLFNYWDGISKLVIKNFGKILTILNVFLYSLFTLAFLCIRTRKYTLSQS
jgi:hypothetical protein